MKQPRISEVRKLPMITVRNAGTKIGSHICDHYPSVLPVFTVIIIVNNNFPLKLEKNVKGWKVYIA